MKTKIEQSLNEANKLADESYATMRSAKQGTFAYNLARSDFYLYCGKIQALEEVLQML